MFKEDGEGIVRSDVNTRHRGKADGLNVIIVGKEFIELLKISVDQKVVSSSVQLHAIVHGRTKIDVVEKMRQIGYRVIKFIDG